MSYQGFKVVLGARNRTYPNPIPCSESIPDPIPIHDSISKPLSGADSEPRINFDILIGSGNGFGSGNGKRFLVA